MTPHDPSGDSGPAGDVFREVQLGDALGNDALLHDNLSRIDETIREDNPQAGNWLFDKLCMAKAFLPAAWRATTTLFKSVAAGVRLYSETDKRRTLAEAEAYKTRVGADAQAELLRAQARRIDAESEVLLTQGTAIAEEERARTRRKDELLQTILKKGIKVISEHDEDATIVRTLFTKDPGPKMIDSPDPKRRPAK